jgi:hypothetical protein
MTEEAKEPKQENQAPGFDPAPDPAPMPIPGLTEPVQGLDNLTQPDRGVQKGAQAQAPAKAKGKGRAKTVKPKKAKSKKVSPKVPEKPLAQQTKQQLEEVARIRGVPIPAGANKAQVLGLLTKEADIPAVALEKIDPAEVYRIMDDLDGDVIVRELAGEVSDDLAKSYLYEFNQEGKTIRGFSKQGAEQAALISPQLYGIAYRLIGTPHVEETEGDFRAIVTMGRYRLERVAASCEHCGKPLKGGGDVREFLVDTQPGAASQPKKIRLKGGQVKDNPFAYNVAISKARRNAILSLMPHDLKSKMLAYLAGLHGGKTIVKIDAGARPITTEKTAKLHYLANNAGLTHADLTELAKKHGYDSVAAIRMSDYYRIEEEVKAARKGKDATAIPEEVLAAAAPFKAYTRARLEADYASAVAKYGVEKAAGAMIAWLKQAASRAITKKQSPPQGDEPPKSPQDQPGALKPEKPATTTAKAPITPTPKPTPAPTSHPVDEFFNGEAKGKPQVTPPAPRPQYPLATRTVKKELDAHVDAVSEFLNGGAR